jgi:hypothetical protein
VLVLDLDLVTDCNDYNVSKAGHANTLPSCADTPGTQAHHRISRRFALFESRLHHH